MKIVAVASAKGGTGKTTLTAALAVRAARESDYVCMADLNEDQGNLTAFHFARGQPKNPLLVSGIDNLSDAIADLKAEAEEWLFIDTPPAGMDLLDGIVESSDVVLIPVKCSTFDLMAIDPIIELAKKYQKPFTFVLSMVDAKMPRLIAQATATLMPLGPIAKARLTYSQSYVLGLAKGRTGPEADRMLSKEIDELFEEVKLLIEKATTPRRRYGRGR